jgi:TonB family protein
MDGFAGALAAYSLQVLLLVSATGALTAIIRLPPGARLLVWRLIVVACLLMPLAPPRVVDVPLEPRVATSVVNSSPAAATGHDPVASRYAAVSFSAIVAWIVVAGAALRGVWLSTGVARLRTLIRRAPPATLNDDLEVLRRALAPNATVCWQADMLQPATFGVRRAVVLLPTELRAATADIQRAVICHELVHVHRRDWLAMIVEEAVLTIFWFHPAMWWAISQIQLNREAIVDAYVVEMIGSRRAYMRALLDFADAGVLAPATAFARRDIVVRIKELSREVAMSPKRLALHAALLIIVLGMCQHTIVSALPLRTAVRYHTVDTPLRDVALPDTGRRPASVAQTVTSQVVSKPVPPPPPPPPPPHAAAPRPLERPNPVYPPDALRYGVGARVTTHLTIDLNGIVTDAKATKWSLTIDRSIEDPGYWANKPERPFLEAAENAARRWKFSQIDKEAAVDIVFEFRSVPSSVTPGAPSTVGATAVAVDETDRKVIRVGGNIKPPIKIRDVRPIYPDDARAAGIQGVVILTLRISGDGSVIDAKVLRSIPALDDAALTAVQQWRFSPTLLNGEPVDVIMTVTVNFVANQ